MTNGAEINSELQLCHDPEGGGRGQSLVGGELNPRTPNEMENDLPLHRMKTCSSAGAPTRAEALSWRPVFDHSLRACSGCC